MRLPPETKSIFRESERHSGVGATLGHASVQGNVIACPRANRRYQGLKYQSFEV
jgi:hypothetical protein